MPAVATEIILCDRLPRHEDYIYSPLKPIKTGTPFQPVATLLDKLVGVIECSIGLEQPGILSHEGLLSRHATQVSGKVKIIGGKHETVKIKRGSSRVDTLYLLCNI